MKKALLILAAMAMGASAFAQGTLTFFNRNLTDSSGNLYNAFVWRPGGTVGAGDGYTAGLFMAGAPDSATPIATTLFRPSSGSLPGGFASSQDVEIPGVAVQGTANLIVRAWATAAGSYANAVATGAVRGQSDPFLTQPLGGPNPTPGQPPFAPPGMGPNFREFTMVPEPSTYALAALGIGALLMRRRK